MIFMEGITSAGYAVLFGLALVGVLALVKAYKNRKKWTEDIFKLRVPDKGIPGSYFYRSK